METQCINCRRQLRDTDQAIKLFLFAQSFGMRPRLKSGAEAVAFCPHCAVSLAFGPTPENGQLYQAAHRRLKELVGWNQDVTREAWISLHGVINPAPLLTSGDPKDRPPLELPYGIGARAS